jgi:sugar phosphate isomerase/epimerase
MIRLCHTVATPDTADPDMLALRGPFEENFLVLQRCGYDAAELMVRDPSHLNASAIARSARDHGLTIPAVSTGQLRKEDGLSLSNPDDVSRRKVVDRTRSVLDFAAEFGAIVNIGTLRGHLPPLGPDREQAMEAARLSFRELLSHAGPAARIAVEPQCRYVINWLNTVDSAVAWTAQFQDDRLGILFDLYHAMLEEDSVHAALIRSRSRTFWMQVADTNRLAPGRGSWNFGETIRILDALRYDGFLSVECVPDANPKRSAADAAAHLRRTLDLLGEIR